MTQSPTLYLNAATGLGTVAGLSGQVADLSWLRDAGLALVAAAILVKLGNRILSWLVNRVTEKFEEIVALPAAIGTLNLKVDSSFGALRQDIAELRLIMSGHSAADSQWKTGARERHDALALRIAALEQPRGFTRRAGDPGEPQP